MVVDAMGNEIVIGEYYGYSKSSNGFTYVVTGKAYKTANGKVTLEDITEKSFSYVSGGVQEPYKITKEERRRNIGSVQAFHIPNSVMTQQNAPEHDCMSLDNRDVDGLLYRCKICKTIL